jgi:hypothetical protein
MSKRYDITLDLYFNSPKKIPNRYVMYDRHTYPLYITLLAHDEPFVIPDDAIIEVSLVNAKGKVRRGVGEIYDAQNGVIVYRVKPKDVAEVGKLCGGVSLIGENIGDDGRLTWPEFEMKVYRSLAAPDCGNDAGDVLPFEYLLKLLNKVNQIADRMDVLEDSIENIDCGCNCGGGPPVGDEHELYKDSSGQIYKCSDGSIYVLKEAA